MPPCWRWLHCQRPAPRLYAAAGHRPPPEKQNQPNFHPRGTSLEPTQRGGLAKFQRRRRSRGNARTKQSRNSPLLFAKSQQPKTQLGWCATVVLKTTGFGSWELQNTKKRHLRAPSAALVFACSQNEPKRGDEARKAAFLSAILWCYPCFLFSAENLLTPHSPKNQPIFRFQPWPNGVETGEILL